MNSLAEEILSYLGTAMNANASSNALAHYGMPFRSGRYPYGSGENPYQHYKDFLGRIEALKKSNLPILMKMEKLGLAIMQLLSLWG